MDRSPQERSLHLFVVLLVGFAYLGYHLVRLTVVDAPRLSTKAEAQRERHDIIRIGRGRILDARGQVLAGNIGAVSVYADAKMIDTLGDAERAFELVKHLPGVDREKFLKNYESKKRFFWVARNVNPQDLSFVESKGGHFSSTIPELSVLTSERRVYPKGSMAGFLLGFTGVDNQGLEGLELHFDKYLKGREGRVELKRDGRGRAIPGSARVVLSARRGQDVRLTLDAFVQHSAESHLAEAVNSLGAKGGHAVVVRAKTGDVLALASVPRLDPAKALKVPAKQRRNRMLVDVYEPGSVFKTIMAAGALEQGVITPNEKFSSPASMKLGRFTINDSSHKNYGMVTIETILQKSLNIGAANVGFKMGPKRLEETVRAFGFDRPTGMNLSYESKGLWPAGKSEWKKAKVATVSYGHGISVTPVQVARSYAAIANGGVLPPLRLVDTVGGKKVKGPNQEAPKRILSEENAKLMQQYLITAAEDGTGTRAVLDNYHVGGKTGTTRKIRAGGRGYESRYIGSFVGMFPGTRPEYVILVTIDEPRGTGYGGVVAAPVFKKIAEDLAFYYKVTPDKVEGLKDGMAFVPTKEKEAPSTP